LARVWVPALEKAELVDMFTCGLLRVNTSLAALAGAAGSKDSPRNATKKPAARSGFDGIMKTSPWTERTTHSFGRAGTRRGSGCINSEIRRQHLGACGLQ
jgi:hypothetical protein